MAGAHFSLWRHLCRRSSLVWAGLLAVVAGGLCFVPLFDALSYEFCLALALFASPCGAHLGSVFGKTFPEIPIGRAFLLATLGHLLLLLVPLVLITANALRVRNCNYLEGLAFFALLPVASVGCATALGLLAARLVRRPALATGAALGVVLVSVLLMLLRLYLEPPIYAYDPFVGYFPGAIYDEDVAVGAPLVWFRAMNVCVIAAFLLAVERRSWPALLSGLGALALFGLGPSLGFRNTARAIEAELGGRHETEHFVILHALDGRRRDLTAIGRDHEFRYAQLEEALGVRPGGKIRSYLFPSIGEKKRLLGAGRTDVAKPWLREIYLTEEEPPQNTLKHELAHVFGAAIAGGFLGLPRTLDMGVIEGFAVALDWPVSEGLDPHGQSRAMRDNGVAPGLDEVFGTGFLGNAPARGYTVAGSVIRHLLDNQGGEKLRRAYASGDLEATYGKPLSALQADWERKIGAVRLDPGDRAVWAERFRRPAIWRRTCAHEIAMLKGKADDAFSTRPGEAARILRTLVDYEPDEPSYLLSLSEALQGAGSLGEAKRESRRALEHPAASAPIRQRAHMRIGDLAWSEGDYEAAARAYRLAAAEPSVEAQRRLIAVKLLAVTAAEPRREQLRLVLLGDEGRRDAFIDGLALSRMHEETPDDGLASYLIGRRLWERGRFARAVQEMNGCREPLSNSDLLRECRRILALSSWRAGDLDRAESAALSLRVTDANGGDLAFARDMLERLTWERRSERAVSSPP